MNKTILTVEQVRGLVLASAKGDVRFYLNGALVDFEDRRAVSTDGHGLLALNIDAAVIDPAYGSVIIPRDALETISKAGKKDDTVKITYGADGLRLVRSSGLSIDCDPIDGPFPQWQRTIPDKPSGDVTQFNPDWLARISKALRLAVEPGKSAAPYVLHNGLAASIVGFAGFEDKAIAVLMPVRIDVGTGAADFFARPEAKTA